MRVLCSGRGTRPARNHHAPTARLRGQSSYLAAEVATLGVPLPELIRDAALPSLSCGRALGHGEERGGRMPDSGYGGSPAILIQVRESGRAEWSRWRAQRRELRQALFCLWRAGYGVLGRLVVGPDRSGLNSRDGRRGDVDPDRQRARWDGAEWRQTN